MAYSELDNVWLAHFVGYGKIWVQSEPRLDNAIKATQSIADGGTRPDSSVENFIKSLLYGSAAVTGTAGVTPGPTPQNVTFSTPATRGLIQIENTITIQDAFLGASSADGGEVKIDPAREIVRLRSEGRRLAHGLARMLGMKGVRADVFSASPVISDEGDPFAYSDLEHWRGGP